MTWPEFTVLIAGFVVYLFALLLVTIITWRLFRLLFRAVVTHAGILGANPLDRVLGLGIVVFFWPQLGIALLVTPLRLVVSTLASFAISFTQLWVTFARQIDELIPPGSTLDDVRFADVDFSMVLESAKELFLGTANQLSNGFLGLFSGLAISDIVLGLAYWVLAGQCVGFITPRQGADSSREESGTSRLVSFIRSTPYAARQNTLLAIALLVGLYLSVVAIVAIPWLREDDSATPLTAAKLDEYIQAVTLKPDDFSKPADTGDPFEELESFIKGWAGNAVENAPDSATNGSSEAETEEQPSKLSASEPPVPTDVVDVSRPSSQGAESGDESSVNEPQKDSRLAQVKRQRESIQDVILEEIKNERRKRENLISRWAGRVEDLKDRHESLSKNVKGDFELNVLTHMSARERELYFKDLVHWYRNQVNLIQRNLYDSQQHVHDRDGVWKRWVGYVQTFVKDQERRLNDYLQQDSHEDSSLDWRYLDWRDSPYFSRFLYEHDRDAADVVYDEYRTFNTPIQSGTLPNPPEPGLGWGPFGAVSNWLLRTRSPALMLISGMLGFGILGSAISSFVRQRHSEPGPDQPLVPNVLAVIVSGLSAAMVVFLSVEGGLAVFASGEQEPNPYLLFFTCLLGAVFSERIWDWAKEKLTSRFSRENKPATTGERDSAAEEE